MIRRGFTNGVFAVLALLLPSVSLAADPDEFLARTYTEPGTGAHLPYRLFVPTDYDPAKEYPLILFLHGAGDSGTDNLAQVRGAIDNLLAHVKIPEYSSFLLAPQTNSGWASYNETPSAAMRMARSVIEQLTSEFSIDSTRLYVTGFSMGGCGAWETIWQNPGWFAAAVPICGWGDTSKASLLVDQPIWAFHNADDGTMSVEYSRDMIAAIQIAGGCPLYTEYATGGHNAWSRAYNEPQLYDWMFSQAVPEPFTMALLATGAISLLPRAWRRRKRIWQANRGKWTCSGRNLAHTR